MEWRKERKKVGEDREREREREGFPLQLANQQKQLTRAQISSSKPFVCVAAKLLSIHFACFALYKAAHSSSAPLGLRRDREAGRSDLFDRNYSLTAA